MELPNKEIITIAGRGFELELRPEKLGTAVIIQIKEARITAVKDNDMMYIYIGSKER